MSQKGVLLCVYMHVYMHVYMYVCMYICMDFEKKCKYFLLFAYTIVQESIHTFTQSVISG